MRRYLIIIAAAWLAFGVCRDTRAQFGAAPTHQSVNGFKNFRGDKAVGAHLEANLNEASEVSGRLDDSEFLIVVRLSPEILQSFLFKEVQHRAPVNRFIMGTHSTGESLTNGTVVVDMMPGNSHNKPVLLVRLTGTIQCRTVGRNGPALIRSRTNSNFVCERAIRFDSESGFVPLSSKVKASPQIHYEGFSSDRSGIRGRIISRAASRRAEESRAQATEIVRSIQEEELQKIFDSRLNANIASLNRKLQFARVLGPFLGQRTQLRMAAVAAPEGLKIGFAPASTSSSLPRLPQWTLHDAPVEVWLRVNSMGEKPRGVFNIARLAVRALDFDQLDEFSVSLSDSEQSQPPIFPSTLLLQGWIRFGIGQEIQPRT